MPNEYLIKSLRADEFCFYRKFIGTISFPYEKTPLRRGSKKKYTVTGRGVYERSLKLPQYKKEVKQGFTQAQSTSLVFDNFQPLVFGHSKEREDKLVGIMVELNDALLSDRLFLYDGGTVDRPYDFDTEQQALTYFKDKRNANEKELFHADELDEFKQTIAMKKNATRHNEVLAHVRWNMNTSKIFIATNTLEARLIAQEYSSIFIQHLKKQAKINNIHFDENYKIPIVFYLPGETLHQQVYDISSQEKDRDQAKKIYSSNEKFTKYNEKDYEFLFFIDNYKEAILSKVDSKYLILKILEQGYVHVVQSLIEKAGDNILEVLDIELVDKAQFKNNAKAFYHLCRTDENILVEWYLKQLKQAANDSQDYLQLEKNLLNQALHLAVKDDDWKTIGFLIKKGADINLVFDEGNTLLHLAIMKEMIGVAKELVESGIKTDVLNNPYSGNKMTPLHLAAEKKSLPMVKLLVSKGANVNAQYQSSWGNPEGTALHFAVRNLEILEFLLSKNLDVNLYGSLEGSCLSAAAASGSVASVKLLLENKAEIKKEGMRDESPLHVAAERGHLDVVCCLVEHGADIEAIDINQETPLFKACSKNNYTVVQYLLEKKANICVQSKYGSRVFHAAARVFDPKNNILKLLLDKGANINEMNDTGETALHVAALNGNLALIKFLCGNGANVNAGNDWNNTPLFIAIRNASVDLEHFNSVFALIEHGANINAMNKSGRTPIFEAIEQDNIKLVRFLLQKGAKLNISDVMGITPLKLAENNKEIFALLQTYELINQIEVQIHQPKSKNPFMSSYEKKSVVLEELINRIRQNNNTKFPEVLAQWQEIDNLDENSSPCKNKDIIEKPRLKLLSSFFTKNQNKTKEFIQNLEGNFKNLIIFN